MSARLSRDNFDRLLALLRERGYRLVGPTIRDGAIVYDELEGAASLPIGWTDEQGPGRYRLRRRDDDAYFGYVLGPQGPRRHLTPPVEPLVKIRRRSLEVEAAAPADEPLALIGVRACELAAMGITDRVWTGGPFVDPRYADRRGRAFIVAVDCLEPGELCFCAATKTGPEVREGAGFDLRLTEQGGAFLLEVGSARGQEVADAVELEAASADDERARRRGLRAAEAAMRGRGFDAEGLPQTLFANLEHPRWQEVADRCLSCGNCTQVCPTCFCHRVEERAPLDAEAAERVRYWDSCFTDEHSRIHGAQFRPQTRERYRQWATHKLGSWVSQFGSSGCVGCGRCIAWCPVGIDLTEEVRAIQASPRPPADDACGQVRLPAARTYAKVAGDPMRPQLAAVTAVTPELADTVTLHVEPAGPFRHLPGQFCMLSVPEVGEVPISISGQEGAAILHTVRAVGAASRALTELRPGDRVGLRGPFGSAWPLDQAKGRNVIVIAGGLGLAPLRGALRELVARPEDYPSVRLLYGARSPDDILYGPELLSWDRSIRFGPETVPAAARAGHVKVHVTVDRGGPGWTGHVGVVTTLMRRKPMTPHALYLLCGPEVMMRFVLAELDRASVPAENIWLSMERNMKCAAGLCGRCQYGPYFICKDGPVFRRDQLAGIFGREGF
jgi:NAD(P)H-flavin reductase/Pyruvate/2-oxoacid:ferredoxin oxidoreductase delta subunit